MGSTVIFTKMGAGRTTIMKALAAKTNSSATIGVEKGRTPNVGNDKADKN